MIPQEKLDEIKNYLEKAENPLFLFDDDNDGLCSFVLFRQFTEKGTGIPIKANPELGPSFLNRVQEHHPDFVFVLDKPIVSQEFIDNVNVPIIWLDHHPPIKRNGIRYYNPKLDDPKENSSTTYWCYKTVGGKLWIGAIGAISDWTIPDYFKELKKQYPELVDDKNDPPSVLYGTKFGELCRIFSFLLKGKTSDVNKNIKTIFKINEPSEILEKTTKDGEYLYEQSEKISKIYQALLKKALENEKTKDNILVFSYTSDTSLTADLSNELLYRNPDKVIIIAREKSGEMKMSIRSSRIPVDKILGKALMQFEGYGGGHKFAVGANVKAEDFPKFVEFFKKEISQK